MDTLVRHIWNNKDPKEYATYESTIIRLLNELDKDSTRHDSRMKFRSVQKQFLKSLDKNKTILLYLKDDEVVGLTLMIVSEGLVSTMSISDLIVDSKHRNKGYGSYILEDSINYAKERKFKNVCLQVFTNNTVARNMYIKRGFKPVTEFMMLGLESMNTINKDTYILEIGNEDGHFQLLNLFNKILSDKNYIKSPEGINNKDKIIELLELLKEDFTSIHPHNKLKTDINVELTYQYLKDCQWELEILNKWIRFPNIKLLSQLEKVAVKLSRYTTFNPKQTTLYRGFRNSDASSVLKQKYTQKRLGLSEVENPNSRKLQINDKFVYRLDTPYSFSRDINIAKKFGEIVVSTDMSKLNHKFIDNNDSLILAVYIHNGYFKVPYFYDHVRFLQEVIILPSRQDVEFTLVETDVDIFSNKYTKQDSHISFFQSLYTPILILLGMDNLDMNTEINIGNEGIIDKILDTLLPGRSKKFVQATPEEKKERKERIDSFIKCHQHVIKDFPKEFASTFAVYANDEGITEYPENKALQYCVVFHASGHESIFEEHVDNYRKALTNYVKEKSQGKYTAKVDDLSQAGPHNLGVFVLMIPLQNKVKEKKGNEGLFDFFKDKDKELIFKLLKSKYKANILQSFNNYKEARAYLINTLKDVENKLKRPSKVASVLADQVGYTELSDPISKQEFIEDYLTNVYKKISAMSSDPFIEIIDNGYIRYFSANDDSESKRMYSDAINYCVKILQKRNSKYTFEFKRQQDDFIISVKVNHCLIDRDLEYLFKSINKANESLYQSSLSRYEYLLTYDFDSVALESFGSEITRIITGILDTVLKLLNNFKTVVLGVFKDLKRTELQEYEDSNKITLTRVLKYPYEFLAQQNVVVPRGMVKPYKYTAEKIKGCLDTLDMVNRSERALTSVDNVLKMLLANTKFQVKQDTINVGELRSLEYMFKDENNCFSTFKRCEEQQFSKVFQSDHCLRDTYNVLVNTVIYEQDVSRVYATLERIYQKFDHILRLVESNQVNLTKSDIITLAGQTTTLAKLFDMYGTVITDLQRVEHNFVLILRNISEKYGL